MALRSENGAHPAPFCFIPWGRQPCPAPPNPMEATMFWPDYSPTFYLASMLAILLAGISKGGFGAAAGGLAVPLMSIVIAPPEAAGIMLPILCAMDLFGVHAWRGRWSVPHLRRLLPGGLVGIALGALAFGLMSVNAIRLIQVEGSAFDNGAAAMQ